MLNENKILKVEIVGTIFIILLGSALHFTYASSGNNPLAGFISAVNESVWEHLKLAYWPALLWMLITIFLLKNEVNNFFFAKAVGAFSMIAFIPAVFYLYTAFTGESIFAIDIASFFAAVIIGQFISYRLFKLKQLPRFTGAIAVATMTLMAIIFTLFTFYPPHLPIFQDSITGRYGV